MRIALKRTVFAATGFTVVYMASLIPAAGQTTPAAAGQKVLMSEDVFKNIQVLKGIPVNQFMQTMGMFAASLSLNCTDCHVPQSLSSWEKYAEDVPRKQTARRMMLMVSAMNKANFGGRNVITCYTCHRGGVTPKAIPSLAEQYSAPPPEDANEIEIIPAAAPGPSADQILDRYIQALGGATRLAALTSFTAKGTYKGFDTDMTTVSVDLFAKAPGQRSMIVHTGVGDSTTTYDGRTGWFAANDKPLPVLELPPGADLDGLKLDAELDFPGRIKQMLTQWRVGFPETAIDDHDMQVVQGLTASKARVKLFFDKQSGLLVRHVRYVETPVGTVPVQVDYGDYRDVMGVKMPYHLVMTWTDGRSVIDLTELKPNVPIDNAKFAKPAPPAPMPKAAAR